MEVADARRHAPLKTIALTGENVRPMGAVAAPDEHSGEKVRVVVVRKDPALTKEQVLAHCKQHLTGYKVPKLIEFWKELPKTNVGKVLRREVKNAPVQG